MPSRGFKQNKLPIVLGIQSGTRCLACSGTTQPELVLEVSLSPPHSPLLPRCPLPHPLSLNCPLPARASPTSRGIGG